MHGIDFPTDDNVLVGRESSDDAGVYRVSEELALVQTVDFFTPVVDDPCDFGRIAAANALSDVYAMGGRPTTAMNLVGWPVETLGIEHLRAMLAGGAEKVREAGAVVVGGHTVIDEELKYGLAVTGHVHPQRIWKNRGLQPGDALFLTKGIGTGIINTAIKGGLAGEAEVRRVTEVMATLNAAAAEVLAGFPLSACTDVTGFGLLGHLAEMVEGEVRVEVDSGAVPQLPGAYDYAAIGLVPAGAHSNREFRQKMVAFPPGFDPVLRDLLFDPQTSGGLLFGCRSGEAEEILDRLHAAGVEQAARIGGVVPGAAGIVVGEGS